MRGARGAKRSRLALAGAGAVLAIAVLTVLLSGGGSAPAPLPEPGIGAAARSGNPFAYSASSDAELQARASAGSAHVIFTKSPGGAIVTAARVASYRKAVDAATRGTGIDPSVLEAIVFLESAGRPQVIAGSDPSAAAGLTQILAQTGQSLLGMHIDLARSRRLTAAIYRADSLGESGLLPSLLRRRAKIDDRFDPSRALAATVRYLELARRRLGRSDLAVVSYHMGIGNLQHVLSDYDGGRAVPYVQLYFDTSPDRMTSAYELLSSFGDDSSLYYWRILAAVAIMHLYRSNPAGLSRLAALQSAGEDSAEVLHPLGATQSFGDPAALAGAYARHTIVPLPSNGGQRGLAYAPAMGSLASRLGAPGALYRGLRAPALDLLIELAARVRALAGGHAPLIVSSTVTDARYQGLLGFADPPATTGYTFQIARRYASRAQALALQATLDRLQALNLIAWTRKAGTIEVTVASDASRVIARGV